jgi:hypothetical protein
MRAVSPDAPPSELESERAICGSVELDPPAPHARAEDLPTTCSAQELLVRPTRLMHELPAELLALIASKLHADDRLAAALSCSAMREAVALGPPLTTRVHSLYSSLPRLQWGITSGVGLCAMRCAEVALLGQLEQLAWLREVGCPWNDSTTECAARGGHMAVLQWARAHGCTWSITTCHRAARAGQLATLQWAVANGCEWSTETSYHAAAKGRLSVLQWLVAIGCPLDKTTCICCAAGGGHLEVLQWLVANGCECEWLVETSDYAAQGRHLHVLQWLVAIGCPFNKKTAFQSARVAGHLEVLQWLVANGCEWSHATCTMAAEYGHLHVL